MCICVWVQQTHTRKPICITGGRFYVVVLGGATQTERRYIYEISRCQQLREHFFILNIYCFLLWGMRVSARRRVSERVHKSERVVGECFTLWYFALYSSHWACVWPLCLTVAGTLGAKSFSYRRRFPPLWSTWKAQVESSLSEYELEVKCVSGNVLSIRNGILDCSFCVGCIYICIYMYICICYRNIRFYLSILCILHFDIFVQIYLKKRIKTSDLLFEYCINIPFRYAYIYIIAMRVCTSVTALDDHPLHSKKQKQWQPNSTHLMLYKDNYDRLNIKHDWSRAIVTLWHAITQRNATRRWALPTFYFLLVCIPATTAMVVSIRNKQEASKWDKHMYV